MSGSIDEISAAIGELRSEVGALQSSVAEMKKTVDSLQQARYIGIGILAAVAALGGIVGLKVAAIWHFIIGG